MKKVMTKEPLFGVAALAAAAALAATVSTLPPERAAQVGGADLLSVLFADARAIAGVALVQRADRYFHGGVEIDYCPDSMHEAEHGEHEPGEAEAVADPPPRAAADPWSWINARVHVQEHRHLSGAEVDEMVPWIWAACQADPRNIEAWEIGWYALAKMRKLPKEGLAVLEAGLRANPLSAQLEFTRGQCLHADFKDDAAAEAAFQSARAKALATADGAPGKLKEDEAMVLVRALEYLAFFAEKRGDFEAIRRYYREAAAAAPDFASTRHLRARLEAAPSAPNTPAPKGLGAGRE